MSTSLDQLFLQRIEDIIAKEKWLSRDPIRSLQRSSAGSSAGDMVVSAAPVTDSDPTSSCASRMRPPLPLAASNAVASSAGSSPGGGGFSPKLLLLCLVVPILILIILIVYML